ncbi:hypothetical protein K493DRAFT_410326 [Basidiobolus meristosporus CBS 931.73]|uniref:Uncharacterized protein n=1 Tax=Basidiobolus meristosporus CBS 931.73 TaxID=1314790 RepID=A0A1Y1XVA3_9FUNG|nr:hypothetical protein K493DRAFT_410326 [Basidiobolus meristosporus CBS 931.73]|eukprot:ORX89605.1 hypothetical protein K493DRAFT_410326 [Basidiobolus meristosporus CBS 931.73]
MSSKKDMLLVADIAATFFPAAIQAYSQHAKLYDDWQKISLKEIEQVWERVPVKDAEKELRFLREESRDDFKDMLSAVKSFIDRPLWISRVMLVQEIKAIYGAPECYTSSVATEDILTNLKSPEHTLGSYQQALGRIQQLLNSYDRRFWKLLQEMVSGKDFLQFLTAVVENDLRNIINGVDDYDDARVIQEETIFSMIEVQRSLKPVLQAIHTWREAPLLNMLQEIARDNPVLHSRISLCAANNVALQNLYNNIANRGEATKDKIANAVKRGTYDFVFQERVDVLLNYRGESKQTSLAELQDLCGRARLYARSAMSEAKSLSLGAEKDEEHMADIMHEFVQIVDTIQGMIPIATKLIRLGHLKYINFVRKAVRKSELVALATELKEDLQDLFTSIQNQIVTQAMLIFRLNATIYFDSTTRKHRLRDVLDDLPKTVHTTFPQLPQSTLDIVQPGKLFVVACASRYLIPNIVISLFVNSGHSSKLFCVAGVDILSSETQYYLVKMIQEHRTLCDYMLALICCQSENENHHILDQFASLVVRSSGLADKSMKRIYSDFRNVTCVTSAHSGQGKTTRINQICGENRKHTI